MCFTVEMTELCALLELVGGVVAAPMELVIR
jgi:hypothetical protein